MPIPSVPILWIPTEEYFQYPSSPVVMLRVRAYMAPSGPGFPLVILSICNSWPLYLPQVTFPHSCKPSRNFPIRDLQYSKVRDTFTFSFQSCSFIFPLRLAPIFVSEFSLPWCRLVFNLHLLTVRISYHLSSLLLSGLRYLTFPAFHNRLLWRRYFYVGYLHVFRYLETCRLWHTVGRVPLTASKTEWTSGHL